MLFISDVDWIVLKMICMSLNVRLQTHTKVFRYISAYRGGEGQNFAKFIVTYLCCTKYNENKYLIQLYKSMSRIQDHTKEGSRINPNHLRTSHRCCNKRTLDLVHCALDREGLHPYHLQRVPLLLPRSSCKCAFCALVSRPMSPRIAFPILRFIYG